MTEKDLIRKETGNMHTPHLVCEGSGAVPLLKYPLLERQEWIDHGFTTKEGGVSDGCWESLNLSYTRGDKKEAVDENFNRLAKTLGVSTAQMVCSDQTHKTQVLRVGQADGGNGIVRPKPYTDIDGLVTNESGVVLLTFYADCVPLFFVDPLHHAIGLSHSGWRGTVGRMGARTLEKMSKEFGTRPEDVLAAIGPSICQDCYEVSSDVADAFAAEFAGHEEELLISKGNGKFQLNLWRANELVLTEAGIKNEHLETTDLCTCCNHKYLFSHRASQGKRGNLAAYMFIK